MELIKKGKNFGVILEHNTPEKERVAVNEKNKKFVTHCNCLKTPTHTHTHTHFIEN